MSIRTCIHEHCAVSYDPTEIPCPVCYSEKSDQAKKIEEAGGLDLRPLSAQARKEK